MAFGTFLKSALTVAATGAAALTGVALASDGYTYVRRKIVGSSSSSSSSSRKRSKKKTTAKKAAKARRRSPAAKLAKHKKAA